MTVKYAGIDPERFFGVDGYVGNTPLIRLRRLSSCPVITCNSRAMPERGVRASQNRQQNCDNVRLCWHTCDFSAAIRPDGDAVTMKGLNERKRFPSHSGGASTPPECPAA